MQEKEEAEKKAAEEAAAQKAAAEEAAKKVAADAKRTKCARPPQHVEPMFRGSLLYGLVAPCCVSIEHFWGTCVWGRVTRLTCVFRLRHCTSIPGHGCDVSNSMVLVIEQPGKLFGVLVETR